MNIYFELARQRELKADDREMNANFIIQALQMPFFGVLLFVDQITVVYIVLLMVVLC